MKKITRVLLVLLMLSACIFVAGCGKDKEETSSEKEVVEDTTLYCPLDHAEISEMPDRVFAVAIDNGPKSQPQSGLSEADFLFEVPVEGGINRFLALYYHNMPDVIGPVRSARHPFIPLVNSYNGIYVHCGGSYLFEEQKSAVDEIDEKGNSSTFWRDKTRSAPTNLYTSYEKLVECADGKGMMDSKDTAAYTFYSKEEIAKGFTKGTNTYVNIPYTYKSVKYTWNEEGNHYLRFSKEEPHMDAASESQLYADNLILMTMDVFPARPGEILMDMTFVGNQGDALLFQNGNATKMQWSMAGEKQPLRFQENGKDVKLLPGRTIVQIVPKEILVDYDGASSETAE